MFVCFYLWRMMFVEAVCAFKLIFNGLLYSENFSRCYLEQQLIFWRLPLLLVEKWSQLQFVFIVIKTFPILAMSKNRNFLLVSFMTKSRKCILGTHSTTKVIISNYFVVRKRFDIKHYSCVNTLRHRECKIPLAIMLLSIYHTEEIDLVYQEINSKYNVSYYLSMYKELIWNLRVKLLVH